MKKFFNMDSMFVLLFVVFLVLTCYAGIGAMVVLGLALVALMALGTIIMVLGLIFKALSNRRYSR